MSLTRRIKDEALYLGFKKVGMSTADDFIEYIEVLEAHPDIAPDKKTQSIFAFRLQFLHDDAQQSE